MCELYGGGRLGRRETGAAEDWGGAMETGAAAEDWGGARLEGGGRLGRRDGGWGGGRLGLAL